MNRVLLSRRTPNRPFTVTVQKRCGHGHGEGPVPQISPYRLSTIVALHSLNRRPFVPPNRPLAYFAGGALVLLSVFLTTGGFLYTPISEKIPEGENDRHPNKNLGKVLS
jgi:hypothetical protein